MERARRHPLRDDSAAGAGAGASKRARTAQAAPAPAPAPPLLPQTVPAQLGAIAGLVGVQEVDVLRPRGGILRPGASLSNTLKLRKLGDGRRLLVPTCQALQSVVEAGCGACQQGWVAKRAASHACLG